MTGLGKDIARIKMDVATYWKEKKFSCKEKRPRMRDQLADDRAGGGAGTNVSSRSRRDDAVLLKDRRGGTDRIRSEKPQKNH